MSGGLLLRAQASCRSAAGSPVPSVAPPADPSLPCPGACSSSLPLPLRSNRPEPSPCVLHLHSPTHLQCSNSHSQLPSSGTHCASSEMRPCGCREQGPGGQRAPLLPLTGWQLRWALPHPAGLTLGTPCRLMVPRHSRASRICANGTLARPRRAAWGGADAERCQGDGAEAPAWATRFHPCNAARAYPGCPHRYASACPTPPAPAGAAAARRRRPARTPAAAEGRR